MSNHVLITGHSKGVGKRVAEMLLLKNYLVTGIARSMLPEHHNLTQFSADLSVENEINKVCNYLNNKKFNAVLLNAGFNRIKPAESYSIDEIIRITNVNYTSQAAILNTCLPALLNNKGRVIGMGSISGKEVARWNNFYGASKASMNHLLNNYFEQYRKQNLKVTTIVPDIINSEFYQEQDFEPSTNDDAYINVNDIAELIVDLIESKKNYNLNEIVIKPQRFEINRKKTDSK